MVDVLDLIDAVQEVRCQLIFLSASVEPMLRNLNVEDQAIGLGLSLVLYRLAEDLQLKVLDKR